MLFSKKAKLSCKNIGDGPIWDSLLNKLMPSLFILMQPGMDFVVELGYVHYVQGTFYVLAATFSGCVKYSLLDRDVGIEVEAVSCLRLNPLQSNGCFMDPSRFDIHLNLKQTVLIYCYTFVVIASWNSKLATPTNQLMVYG